MIHYFFDIDAMLYFVAPDWWRPRRQTLVSKDEKGELQPTTIVDPATTSLPSRRDQVATGHVVSFSRSG